MRSEYQGNRGRHDKVRSMQEEREGNTVKSEVMQ